MAIINVKLTDDENILLGLLQKKLGKSKRMIMREGLMMVDERARQREKGLICEWIRSNGAQERLDLD